MTRMDDATKTEEAYLAMFWKEKRLEVQHSIICHKVPLERLLATFQTEFEKAGPRLYWLCLHGSQKAGQFVEGTIYV